MKVLLPPPGNLGFFSLKNLLKIVEYQKVSSLIDFVLQGDNGIGIQGIQGPRGEAGEKVKETAFWKYNLKSINIKM